MDDLMFANVLIKSDFRAIAPKISPFQEKVKLNVPAIS